MRFFIVFGAINAFLAVALGAFGAHGLEGKLEPKYMDNWKTAVNYQMFHAVGLLFIAIFSGMLPARSLITISGWFLSLGIVLFSGSLYVLSVTKITMLGAITPLGGVSFLIGWLLVIVAAVKHV